jgi:hypothetical protein
MAELVAGWLVLGGLALVIGDSALSILGANEKLRRGDWLILSLWLGLILCEWFALALSLLSAVSPARFFLPLGAIFAACLARRWRAIASQFRVLGSRDLIAGAAVMAAASFVAAGMRPTPDIGEYHYPAIRWLEEYGSVLGMANVLFRLGAASGVFALSAPFDALRPGQSIGLINGFGLCLIAGQVVVAGTRIATKRGRPSDWFLAAGSLGLLAIGLLTGSFTTTAPEVSVAALTLVIGWRMLAEDEDGGSGSPVPMLLACGALLGKLSALMLVPVSALYAVIGRGLRAWLGAALLVAILVAPLLLASLATSGCLAINVAMSCLPVPWVVSIELVNDFSRYVLQWSRSAALLPADAGPWEWIPVWLSQWLNLVVLGPFAVSTIAYLAIAGRTLNRGERWVLALILPNLALLFVSAPDPRFNYGLFVAPVALLAARLGPMVLARHGGGLAYGSDPIGWAALLAVPLVFSAAAIELHHGYPLNLDRLLRPRAVPAVTVTAHSGNGLSYVVPSGPPGCWGAPLPCADRELEGVRLRAPERGLSGGFFIDR